MRSPNRVAHARLRARLSHRRQRIKTTFTELRFANDALLTAGTGLAACLREGTIEHFDVYELIRALHFRIKQTIADAEQAALGQDGDA